MVTKIAISDTLTIMPSLPNPAQPKYLKAIVFFVAVSILLYSANNNKLGHDAAPELHNSGKVPQGALDAPIIPHMDIGQLSATLVRNRTFDTFRKR